MSKQTSYTRAEILGVEVDAVTIEQAIHHILDQAADHSRPAGYIVKPYVEFMDQAADDQSLRQILNEAELCLADGVALLWAAHYLYGGRRGVGRFWATLAAIILKPKSLEQPLPERIAGINFTWPLLEMAARRGVSVFLIGKETTAEIEATATAIHAKLPNLPIAGTYLGRDFSRPRGDVGEAWFQDVLIRLQHAKPDLILVGMGFPLQEHVIARLAPQLAHGILIGEGGTFDYEQFGGHRQKAPRLMQHLGLEWLWRLLLEPRRWKRQLAIPRFIARVWRAR
jgi:N-acetylglucosaminyldiphosphoundecaprenol N-acetyl-beta-D-mannosaminyltransferase